MSIKSKALSGAGRLRNNHENDGTGGTHGLGAQHHITRLPDPEDISGDGPPETDESLMRVHENRGGGATHGMAATHHTTRIHDAEDVPTEIMETGEY